MGIRAQLTEIDFVRIQPLLPGSSFPPISVSLVVSLPLNRLKQTETDCPCIKRPFIRDKKSQLALDIFLLEKYNTTKNNFKNTNRWLRVVTRALTSKRAADGGIAAGKSGVNGLMRADEPLAEAGINAEADIIAAAGITPCSRYYRWKPREPSRNWRDLHL